MSYQGLQKHRLAATIAVSVVLHAGLMLGIVVDRPEPRLAQKESLRLEITMATPSVSAPDIETAKPIAEPVPEQEPETETEAFQPQTPAPEQPIEIVDEIAGSETLRLSVEEMKNSLAATLGEGGVVYFGETCTASERASGIRRCPEHDQLIDTRRVYYASLFREAFGHIANAYPSFEKDMDRVAALAARSENLAALDTNDPVEASLLREQRAFLQQEIIRIDRQYAQFNLLKIIPIGKRVAKALQQTKSR